MTGRVGLMRVWEGASKAVREERDREREREREREKK